MSTSHKQFIGSLSLRVYANVELAIAQVISSVKNKRTFSILTFMKSKLQNQLAKHLDIAIHMFAQIFFIKEIFLFQVVIIDWNNGNKIKRGVNA
jgi:hypothetical protein